MISKECNKCGVVKPDSAFRPHRKTCRWCNYLHNREWVSNNKVKVKVYADKTYKKNRIKIIAQQTEYAKKHSVQKSEYRKQWEADGRLNLSDSYIKKLICKESTLSPNDIPNEFVECKRAQIQLIRAVK